MLLLAETPTQIREAAERYGHERSVSSMWFEAIQAQWSSAHIPPDLEAVRKLIFDKSIS